MKRNRIDIKRCVRRICRAMAGRTGFAALALVCMAACMVSSCEKTQSYSELLRDEEHAVNRFLAQNRVELNIPADSISFETGKDAPFYKLDEDGYIYMQVISKGDSNDRVEAGDKVYFRFTRTNLKALAYGDTVVDTNQEEFLPGGTTSFIYKNTHLTSSTQWGTGIQWPLKFFGYNCEVNLVLQSYYGFSSDQSNCNPYLINLRYFKPEY